MTEVVKNQHSRTRTITVLRQLREKAGLTREQLVSRLQNRISLRTLQDWENLHKEPSMTRQDWVDFCHAINVSWDQLPLSLCELVVEDLADEPVAVANN